MVTVKSLKRAITVVWGAWVSPTNFQKSRVAPKESVGFFVSVERGKRIRNWERPGRRFDKIMRKILLGMPKAYPQDRGPRRPEPNPADRRAQGSESVLPARLLPGSLMVRMIELQHLSRNDAHIFFDVITKLNEHC